MSRGYTLKVGFGKEGIAFDAADLLAGQKQVFVCLRLEYRDIDGKSRYRTVNTYLSRRRVREPDPLALATAEYGDQAD